MNEQCLHYTATSAQETIFLGQCLGSLLTTGDVVALVGALGSGKTCFTKGLGVGLGIDPEIVVTSPSFSLVNEYEGRHIFYHMDLYRLEDLASFVSAGLEEYIYAGGVVAMEWADRWPQILPEHVIRVELGILDISEREIHISGCHCRSVTVLEHMNKEVLHCRTCRL